MRATTVLVIASSLCAAGSAGAQGVPENRGGLEARVAALEANRVDVTVACGLGESLGAVLAQYAGRSAPLFIRLVGVCVESVTIFRDDVIIFGNAGDGVQAPSGAPHAIQVLGRRVRLIGLTIQAENDAIAVRRGGAIFGRDLAMNVGHGGIVVRGATVEVLNSMIEQTMPSPSPGAAGIRVIAGTAVITGATIRNFAAAGGGQCGICADGSSVTVRNTTIEGNNEGIVAAGAYINAFETLVRNNAGTGIQLNASSTLVMNGGGITGNGSNGVLMIASFASFAGLANNVLIEGNGGPGVRARLNSVVRLKSVTIRTNSGGMQLSDGSVVSSTDGPGAPGIQITANQRGVICLGSPGVGGFGYISSFGGGAFDLDASNVFGNGPLGPNISCPGISVP